MHDPLRIPLPRFGRVGWIGRYRTTTVDGRTLERGYFRAPSRAAYLAVLLAMGRSWEGSADAR